MATVFTNVGKRWVADKMQDAGSGAGIVAANATPKWVAWGTGAGTAVVTDTALATEASEARVSGTMSTITTDTANDTFQVVATIVADGSKEVTNAGVFDASVGGTLVIKGDFAAIPVIVNDTIEFTFQLNFDD